MKHQICKDCGEKIENCSCSNEPYEWFDFKDLKPCPGQKIRVRRVQIVDIEYGYRSSNPEIPDNSNVLSIKDSWIESWCPLY